MLSIPLLRRPRRPCYRSRPPVPLHLCCSCDHGAFAANFGTTIRPVIQRICTQAGPIAPRINLLFPDTKHSRGAVSPRHDCHHRPEGNITRARSRRLAFLPGLCQTTTYEHSPVSTTKSNRGCVSASAARHWPPASPAGTGDRSSGHTVRAAHDQKAVRRGVTNGGHSRYLTAYLLTPSAEARDHRASGSTPHKFRIQQKDYFPGEHRELSGLTGGQLQPHACAGGTPSRKILRGIPPRSLSHAFNHKIIPLCHNPSGPSYTRD